VPSLSMVFDVLAIDRASAVFDRVGDSAGAAGAKVDAATTTTTNAGAKMAAGLGIAAAAAAAYSVKLAADFQQNMTRLVTTAGETAGPNGIGLVSKGILDMAAQVGIGANDLAKGMYIVESAGIHGADALNVLKAAAQGATQEQADLGKTTDALTTILHDYNIPAAQSADVMSKLVTAVSTGKTTLEDFTGSLHSVTPLAAALHVPLADILGDLAAMTASGESADQATQNMADALRHLQAPTAQMTAELAQLGITSQDLSADLSSKGLAGTMQEIEQAILQHLDPATQRVLLPAFNESKTAAADLVSMIGTMPPALAKLSQGLLDGSVTVKDYRSQVRDMGGQAAASGLQFQSLYQTSDGFNQILKQGGPAAQAFTAALQKAVGDSAGLTVALQLTGEHAATVNDNIAKIAGSSREAGGNIKGWSEVQGNFNQQLHEAGAALESMAIEFGTKLLPYLTDGLHFITTTAIPGIEHLGSAVGSAAHWFSELPGPVKDMALALAALRLADMIGMFDKLSLSMQRFRESMAVQSALGAMEQSAGGAANGVSRLEAAAGLAASRGLAALKAGASGLVSMFGGPWGLAIAGAVLGISAFQSAIERHDQAVQKATQDLIGYYKAIGQGGIGGTDAMAKVAEKQNELSAATQKLNDLIANQNTVYQQAGRGAGGYNSEITVPAAEGQRPHQGVRRRLEGTEPSGAAAGQADRGDPAVWPGEWAGGAGRGELPAGAGQGEAADRRRQPRGEDPPAVAAGHRAAATRGGQQQPGRAGCAAGFRAGAGPVQQGRLRRDAHVRAAGAGAERAGPVGAVRRSGGWSGCGGPGEGERRHRHGQHLQPGDAEVPCRQWPADGRQHPEGDPGRDRRAEQRDSRQRVAERGRVEDGPERRRDLGQQHPGTEGRHGSADQGSAEPGLRGHPPAQRPGGRHLRHRPGAAAARAVDHGLQEP
jgi:TP901 family phage tail tape measure protein